MKYHPLFVILKMRQNLKLSSAANYRWRFNVKKENKKKLVGVGPSEKLHGSVHGCLQGYNKRLFK